MGKLFVLFAIFLFYALPINAAIMQGGVEKQTMIKSNKIIDSSTNSPIVGAKITLPQINYQTFSDKNGLFSLDAGMSANTVLSVEKNGYKPFSVTLSKLDKSHPLLLGIEKATPMDIVINNEMIHLGDNNYSDLSANARDFRVKSVGPYYSKDFVMSANVSADLIIGSIIGIDTLLARKMGQNKISAAYASPPEIYFNGNKIAEIQINGDRQRIKIPYNLINQGKKNEITIKTGRNLMQTSHVDYDDIEVMNISIETK